MTDENFEKKISQFSLPVIANGLLQLEKMREKARELETTAENSAPPLPDEERRKQVGARVRMMRRLLGLTQTELAEQIGVSKQAIAMYETGRREASYKNLVALSRALNVTTDWLLDTPPPTIQ